MACIRNTMGIINNPENTIDSRYDMHLNNIIDIHDDSSDVYAMICNAFKFGYVQGRKAMMAEYRKVAK